MGAELPLSSKAIKKKYGIQDGGELTLIFTRLYPDRIGFLW